MEYLIDSFQYGLVPAIVIVIYLISSKIIESHREIKKDKRSVEVNGELLDCFNELNTYLRHITQDVVGKERDKCISTIRTSFRTLAYDITKFAVFTIIANNIEQNKESIYDNIEYEVTSSFNALRNELVYYDNAETPVVSFIDSSWEKELIDSLKQIIFAVPNSKEQRIYNVHNKLNIRITRYMNKVVSKYLETNVN